MRPNFCFPGKMQVNILVWVHKSRAEASPFQLSFPAGQLFCMEDLPDEGPGWGSLASPGPRMQLRLRGHG